MREMYGVELIILYRLVVGGGLGLLLGRGKWGDGEVNRMN